MHMQTHAKGLQADAGDIRFLGVLPLVCWGLCGGCISGGRLSICGPGCSFLKSAWALIAQWRLMHMGVLQECGEMPFPAVRIFHRNPEVSNYAPDCPFVWSVLSHSATCHCLFNPDLSDQMKKKLGPCTLPSCNMTIMRAGVLHMPLEVVWPPLSHTKPHV